MEKKGKNMDEMTTNMMVCGFFAIALIMAAERCIIAYKEAACNMSIGIVKKRKSTMFLGIAWYIVGTLLISAIGASQTELGNCMATLASTVSIFTFCIVFFYRNGFRNISNILYIAMFVIIGQLIARLGQIMMLQKNPFSADTDIQYLGKYAVFLIVYVIIQEAFSLIINMVTRKPLGVAVITRKPLGVAVKKRETKKEGEENE